MQSVRITRALLRSACGGSLGLVKRGRFPSGSSSRTFTTNNITKMTEASISKKRIWPGWTHGLLQIVDAPEKNADAIFKLEEDYVVIHDKFPKAKTHLLVVPRRVRVDEPRLLTTEHLPLLKEMYSVALQICTECVHDNRWCCIMREADKPMTFFQPKAKRPFSTVPCWISLTPEYEVHMHVISQDLNSPSLKSAKHWNSFSGSFFIDASLFIKALESKGSVSVDWDGAEDTLAAKPICPICNAVFGSGPKQIKELQTHYQSCYSGLVMQKPDELIVTHPAASL